MYILPAHSVPTCSPPTASLWPVSWLMSTPQPVANLASPLQLIASGTAVAAATTGLVFGQLADGHPAGSDSSPRPTSFLYPDHTKAGQKSPAPHAIADHNVLSSVAPSATQTADPSPPRLLRRPSDARTTPPRPSSRRPPTTSSRLAPETGSSEPRDSLSSNGSWLRRLPLRPLSQHSSFRSSVGPDSSSIAFSYASGAPMLAAPRRQSAVLPPNKLVKRASTTNRADPVAIVQLGSRPQITLRRPATSHQRSATLQQQIDVEALSLNQTPLDCPSGPRAQTSAGSHRDCADCVPSKRSTWKSFWHIRIGRQETKGSSFRPIEGGKSQGTKRVCLEDSRPSHVYLVEPKTIMMSTVQPLDEDKPSTTDLPVSPPASHPSNGSPEATPSKPPQRSSSLNLSSPTSWISKSGSLRRKKRGDATNGGTKRAVSGPMEQSATTEPLQEQPPTDLSIQDRQTSRAEADLKAIFRPPRSRPGSTSPLPPALRSLSLRDDRPVGLAESPMHADVISVTTSPGMRIDSRASQTRSNDRASTVASSEYYRGFTSGEDDDMDIKTDTPFDSFRTAASSRRKTGDTTLDSLFDESPPGSAGMAMKPKRLSIQDILGLPNDDQNRILEEDESAPTPIRANHGLDNIRAANGLTSDDMGKDFRVSFDDDDDLDWAQEDEMHLYNNLSPPSSTNSRRASPSLRMALAAINGNAPHEGQNESTGNRPRSTVFDWVEPHVPEKQASESQTLRPKTAYGKKDRDMRGGRAASRKGPTVAHIRSQSVPVVQDQVEATKPTPRFGTWGLGSKNVSEDWDADFEFEEAIPEDPAETLQVNRLSMVVPPSIQATQHTLKTHSGQIRELSLLVNDLKRLCRLGRELQMTGGTAKPLWLEAEDVIALASPDEEESGDIEDASTKQAKDKEDAHDHAVDGRFTAQGFDGSSLDDKDHQAERTGRASDRQGARPAGRRRSVFSPDDEIFGNWDHLAESDSRPTTPENKTSIPKPSTATKAVIEAMRARTKQSATTTQDETEKDLSSRLNFDTNSLKDLVKRASELRDALSDMVRTMDCIAPSPGRTPRRSDRPDGSPAFTRVFDEPNPSPSPRSPTLPHGSTHSSFTSSSLSTSPTTGLSQRLHVMTVG